MERSPEEEGASPEPAGQPPATDTTRDPGSGVPPAGPSAASEALAVLSSFGRRLLVLVPVYLAGAAGLSVGFVLFGLALYLGWRRVRDGKARSLRAARQLLDDEERITAETLYMSNRELPAWVSCHFSPWCGIALPSPSTRALPPYEVSSHLGQCPPPPQTSPRPVSACLLEPIPTLSAHPCRRADASIESGLLPQSTRTTAVPAPAPSQPSV